MELQALFRRGGYYRHAFEEGASGCEYLARHVIGETAKRIFHNCFTVTVVGGRRTDHSPCQADMGV